MFNNYFEQIDNCLAYCEESTWVIAQLCIHNLHTVPKATSSSNDIAIISNSFCN